LAEDTIHGPPSLDLKAVGHHRPLLAEISAAKRQLEGASTLEVSFPPAN
jgi:hypothetical protein